MLSHINVENSSKVLSIADLHDLGDLKNETIAFIKAKKNLKKVKATSGWKLLVETNPALVNELN